MLANVPEGRGRGRGGRGQPGRGMEGRRGPGRGGGRGITGQPGMAYIVDSSKIRNGEAYYAVDCYAIANKMVVAYQGKALSGDMYAMPYTNLTSR